MEAIHGTSQSHHSSLDTCHAPKWPNQRLIIPRPSCATCHLLNEKNRGRERLTKISHYYQLGLFLRTCQTAYVWVTLRRNYVEVKWETGAKED